MQRVARKKLRLNCVEKPPPKKSTESLPNKNLGNTGHKNLNGAPLSEYYAGTAHLGIRSAETLCLRIAKIAAGKMCSFKLVYTDSDCIVPEKTHQGTKIFSLALLSLKQWR